MRHFLSKPFEYWKTDWIKTQKCVRHLFMTYVRAICVCLQSKMLKLMVNFIIFFLKNIILKKKYFTLKHQRQMKKLPKFEKYYLCDQKILFVKLNWDYYTEITINIHGYNSFTLTTPNISTYMYISRKHQIPQI